MFEVIIILLVTLTFDLWF